MFSRILTRKPRLPFWQWLELNQHAILRQLEQDPRTAALKISGAFDRSYRDLGLELGYDGQAGICQLMISANGDLSKSQQVIDVAGSAPVLEGFQVFAFKQRKPTEMMLNAMLTIGNAEIRAEDTLFSAVADSDKLHLRLHLGGYDGSIFFRAGAHYLIEGFLGEVDMQTYIGAIQFKKLEQRHLFSLDPLWKLPVMVDDLKEKLTRQKSA